MPSDQTEMPNASHARYRSYLLRLWQEGPGDERRALLQDVMTGETRRFSSLESLFAFLQPRGEKWQDQERREEGSDP